MDVSSSSSRTDVELSEQFQVGQYTVLVQSTFCIIHDISPSSNKAYHLQKSLLQLCIIWRMHI